MYSYDRRSAKVVTANMSLEDFYGREWTKVLEVTRKASAAASLRAMREVKAMIVNLGLDLDLKHSGIDNHKIPNSWSHSVFLTLRDIWDRGDALTADVVADSVWDATRMQPKHVEKQGDAWVVRHTWGDG